MIYVLEYKINKSFKLRINHKKKRINCSEKNLSRIMQIIR